MVIDFCSLYYMILIALNVLLIVICEKTLLILEAAVFLRDLVLFAKIEFLLRR